MTRPFGWRTRTLARMWRDSEPIVRKTSAFALGAALLNLTWTATSVTLHLTGVW